MSTSPYYATTDRSVTAGRSTVRAPQVVVGAVRAPPLPQVFQVSERMFYNWVVHSSCSARRARRVLPCPVATRARPGWGDEACHSQTRAAVAVGHMLAVGAAFMVGYLIYTHYRGSLPPNHRVFRAHRPRTQRPAAQA